MSEKTGYIYVLTNESFHRDNWVKIGYAEDVEKRVKELSNTSVPLPYEIYRTYEIPRISGVRDPDKLLHDLISKLNPNLRISPNREFFEMLPRDAYDMLFAIAQMHGRVDKLRKNDDNRSDQETQQENEHTVEALFPENTEARSLFEKIKALVLSVDQSLEEAPRQNYVTFKKDGNNTVSVWAKNGWVEVVLNAKTGQIKDDHDLLYDITSRKWSAAHYAFRFMAGSDMDAARDLIEQTINLKNNI